MSLSEKNRKIEEYKSIIVETDNVSTELKNFSTNTNIPLNKIDFNIISYKTLFKTYKEDEDWIEVNEDNIENFQDEDFLLNEDLIIKQRYKIEIFKKMDDYENPAKIVLGGNKYLTKIVATIKKDPPVKYDPQLMSYIKQEINKKLLKQSMLISLFQDRMKQEIERVVAKIRVNEFLDEDETFIVCSCLDPIMPVNDEIIYHYKKIDKKDSRDRIDYAKKGYINAVKKGDIIIEYIKAKEGRDGRNCKGEYIKVPEPRRNCKIDFSISENIEKKEDDNRIIYIAKKNGYVRRDGDKYDIEDRIEVKEISLKTTGSIEAKLDTGVKIDIVGEDEFKDAIGSGMYVESAEIKVKGNIGSGAVVKAKILEVGGQTHKNAEIYGDKIDIKIHKGYAQGNEINIQRVEGGRVNAKIVNIEQIIGGEIIAEKIFVKQLVSHSTLIASEIIEIDQLKGSDNKIIIDPSRVLGYHEKIDELNKKLKIIENEIYETKKMARAQKNLIDKNRENAELIKQKILEFKKDGIEPNKNLINRLKSFYQAVEKYNILVNKLEKLNDEKEYIKKEIDETQSIIMNAKIINHSIWKEYNEIKFVLLSPKIEIDYTTKEGEIIKQITLEKIEEEDFKIIKKNEIEK